jgi:hypothetical protein
LAALFAATGEISYLDEAETTLDATINLLTQNNILKEPCDDVVSSTCDQDQQIFKVTITTPSFFRDSF